MTAPILSITCHEPEGEIVRNVYPLVFTNDNLNKFWQQSAQFPTLFNAEIRGDFNAFCNVLMHYEDKTPVANGLFWVIDDFVGVFFINEIEPTDAQVHYSFFDRRHRGRVDLCKAMLKYVFARYQFNRLSTEVPLYCKPSTFKFIEHLGFRKEGRRRRVVKYNDKWFDTNLYGILSEEA